MTPIPAQTKTRIEVADDYLRRALNALESGHIDDALSAVVAGKVILDTELQFRAARRGQA